VPKAGDLTTCILFSREGSDRTENCHLTGV
jgi:hypothetical protein